MTLPAPGRPVAVAVSGRGLVDPRSPVLVADDEGFVRGNAAFETTRVYGGVPFRLAEHLARLGRSAERLGLPLPSPDELVELCDEALASAGLADAVLRVYWSPGAAGDDPRAIVLVSRIPADFDELRARGVALVALACPRRELPWLLPGTKSVSYAVNLAAQAEARRRGADDAVLVDGDEAQTVLEGPTTNVWWREGETLVTPSVELGILAGETRAAALGLGVELGYAVEEVVAGLDRLLAADEVFTTSAIREVLPVASVDDVAFPSRAAADRLQAALRALAERA